MRIIEAAAAIALALSLAACGRGEKQSATKGAGGANDSAAAVQGPAQASLPAFAGDVQAARQGRQHFISYNCYSCHGGLGGGAMGPSLRDTTWKYGGTDDAILATIAQGRPGGMPSFAKLVPEEQRRQILTYIRSMRTKDEPTFFFSMDDTTTRAGTLDR